MGCPVGHTGMSGTRDWVDRQHNQVCREQGTDMGCPHMQAAAGCRQRLRTCRMFRLQGPAGGVQQVLTDCKLVCNGSQRRHLRNQTHAGPQALLGVTAAAQQWVTQPAAAPNSAAGSPCQSAAVTWSVAGTPCWSPQHHRGRMAQPSVPRHTACEGGAISVVQAEHSLHW